MILKEIADELGIHESTVQSCRQWEIFGDRIWCFELKSFFGQKVSTQSGEDVTTEAIKRRLAALINEENKQKPLSDQKLADLLKAEEVEISRRTVAKYREALNIPGSSKRKRFD